MQSARNSVLEAGWEPLRKREKELAGHGKGTGSADGKASAVLWITGRRCVMSQMGISGGEVVYVLL